jgi:hypothetical protein
MGADNQSQLDILIRTIADVTGFTLTREQADATQAALGKYADSTQDLGKKTEETGLIQEKSTAHARAQFMLFSELNKIVPGLGTALHAAFAGPLGPIILLAAGIAEVTHLIHEQNAALDEQAKAGANADFLSGISARLDAIRSLNEEAAKYVLKLADLEAGEHGVSEELKNQLEISKAVDAARQTLAGAQKGLATAEVQMQVAEGKITLERAAEEYAAIEKKFIADSQAAVEAAQAHEIKQKQDALHHAQSEQGVLDQKQAEAAGAYFQDLGHNKALAADFGNADEVKKKEDDAQKKLDAAVAARDKAHSGPFAVTPGLESPELLAKYAKLDAAVAAAQGTVDDLRKGQQQYLATQTPEGLGKSAALEHNYNRATAQGDENARFIGQIRQQIYEEVFKAAATIPVERATAAAKEKTVDVQEKTRQTKQGQEDFNTIENLNRSSNPSPDLIRNATQAVTEWQSMPAAIQELVAALSGLDVSQLKTEVASAKKQIAEVRSQLSHFGS